MIRSGAACPGWIILRDTWVYCFVIRSASLKETGWRREDSALTVEIENVGYAPQIPAL